MITTYQLFLFMGVHACWIVIVVFLYKLYKTHQKKYLLMCFVFYILLQIQGKMLQASGFNKTEIGYFYYDKVVLPAMIILLLCGVPYISRPIIKRLYSTHDCSLATFKNPITKKNIYLIPLFIQIIMILLAAILIFIFYQRLY